MRIAVGGFEHETNTFAPTRADYQAFVIAKNYPPLLRGDAMIDGILGKPVSAAGALGVFQKAGVEIVPLLWCLATPSAHVTADAYQRITDEIVDGIAAAGPLDGIFLELHGAMVAETTDDGEGTLLARIRALVGPDMPVAVSLDLHANISPLMVESADLLDAYRRYPHTDAAETGARTASELLDMIRTGRRPRKAFRQVDFLIPINGGCTDFGPGREIYYDRLPKLADSMPGVRALSFAAGFPLADVCDVGPSVIAYADTQAAAEGAADLLLDAVIGREAAFLPAYLPADAAIAEAMARAATAAGPVVIADTQDNPGGGGTGDTTGMLRALLQAGARGAVIGALIDPETADRAHALGVGATGTFAIGGKRWPGDSPVEIACLVRTAKAGAFPGSGAMAKGKAIDLGRVALLEAAEHGVLIAVASRTAQTIDRSIFAYLGLVPERLPIIVLKSSVHFRADFTPLASHILVAAAPGPVAIDHSRLTYRKIRPGVRLMPRNGIAPH